MQSCLDIQYCEVKVVYFFNILNKAVCCEHSIMLWRWMRRESLHTVWGVVVILTAFRLTQTDDLIHLQFSISSLSSHAGYLTPFI